MQHPVEHRRARAALATFSQGYKSDEAFITALLIAGGLLIVLTALQFAANISGGLSLLPM